MTTHASAPVKRGCLRCQGRGWVVVAGWPSECPECVPTKLVKGRVVLDTAKLKAAAPAKRVPEIAPKRYLGAGTTAYYAIPTDTE